MTTQTRTTRSDAAAATFLTIRPAFAEDAAAVARLAALDSSEVPAGPLLLAEVDGELWAARSITADAAIADPFRHTQELVTLLAERARQLVGPIHRDPPARRMLRRLRFGATGARPPALRQPL